VPERACVAERVESVLAHFAALQPLLLANVIEYEGVHAKDVVAIVFEIEAP